MIRGIIILVNPIVIITIIKIITISLLSLSLLVKNHIYIYIIISAWWVRVHMRLCLNTYFKLILNYSRAKKCKEKNNNKSFYLPQISNLFYKRSNISSLYGLGAVRWTKEKGRAATFLTRRRLGSDCGPRRGDWLAVSTWRGERAHESRWACLVKWEIRTCLKVIHSRMCLKVIHSGWDSRGFVGFVVWFWFSSLFFFFFCSPFRIELRLAIPTSSHILRIVGGTSQKKKKKKSEMRSISLLWHIAFVR